MSIPLLVIFGLLSAYGPKSLGFVERIFGLLSKTLARRMVNILRSLFQGMEALRTPAGYVEIILCTVLLYGCYTMMIYLPFFSFDFPERYGLGLPAAAVVMVISTVGIIIPTPGGTGTYHYFCSQTLHRIYGTPLPEALAFATVLHGTAYIVLLAAGGPGLLSLPSWRRAERRLDPEADG